MIYTAVLTMVSFYLTRLKSPPHPCLGFTGIFVDHVIHFIGSSGDV